MYVVKTDTGVYANGNSPEKYWGNLWSSKSQRHLFQTSDEAYEWLRLYHNEGGANSAKVYRLRKPSAAGGFVVHWHDDPTDVFITATDPHAYLLGKKPFIFKTRDVAEAAIQKRIDQNLCGPGRWVVSPAPTPTIVTVSEGT